MSRSALCRVSILALAFTSAGAISATAQTPYILWNQPANGNTTSNTSMLIPGDTSPWDTEVADDFDVVGEIQRVVVAGHGCGQCSAPDLDGVWVRFWTWTPNGPGAVQAEMLVDADDPGLLYDPVLPATFDITLPQAFAATGPHFLSIQAVFTADGGWWDRWLANMGAPTGAPLYFRDGRDDDTWKPHVDFFGDVTNSDVGFLLYGVDGDPPPDVVAGCGRWRAYPTPVPDNTTRAILRATAFAGGDGWAVGERTRLLDGDQDVLTYGLMWDGQR